MEEVAAILKCSECKIPAQTIIVDGERTAVRCPRCGIEIDWFRANEMRIREARYHAHKMRSDFTDSIFGDQSNDPINEITKPKWEFFLDFESGD